MSLEPLSLNEARALVELLYDPSRGNHSLYADQKTNALHVLIAELPDAQRNSILNALDYTWPKPQRHRDFPRDIHGAPMYGDKKGHAAWKEAWAKAIRTGSLVQP